MTRECINITATNDDFVANHLIRYFTVEIRLTFDVFQGVGGSAIQIRIQIIEDGKSI